MCVHVLARTAILASVKCAFVFVHNLRLIDKLGYIIPNFKYRMASYIYVKQSFFHHYIAIGSCIYQSLHAIELYIRIGQICSSQLTSVFFNH